MSILEELNELKQKNKGAEAQGYLALRPHIQEWLDRLKENTIVHKEGEWASQIQENMSYLYKYGSIQGLSDYGVNKTCIIVGASPALKKNVQYLKDIEGEYRKEFILIAVNSVTEYLLANDVKPDYVIAVDCDEFLWDRDFSKFNREDLTLVCSPFLHPKIIKNWKGKLMFIPMGCVDEKMQNKVCEVLNALRPIPGCGNAFNQAVFVAYMIMHCKNYIFIGSELSWPKEGKYYVDGKESWDENDEKIQKIDHPDLHGNIVTTTAGHIVFKTWLEDLASKAPGVFINATEAGILGVSLEDGRLPWIHQMYLNGAIALIKKIVDDTKDWHVLEVAKYDLAWHEGSNDGFFRLPFIDEVNKLGAKKILDVGCGDGTAVALLKWFGYDAYGIDISKIASSRWNGVNHRCELSFADDIWVEDNWFDLAYADILEHIPVDHVSETIKEISRVSKNQMFYLDYKDADYLIRESVKPHATVRPPQWWRKEFRRCGLDIVSTPGHRTFITRRKS